MAYTPPERLNISEYFLGDRIRDGLAGRRALLTDRGTLTYGEVDGLASRYGNLLRSAGVRPEERVLVALPDGPEYVAALFGTLRLGAVVVMVNPHLPADQIRYFFEYTRARAAFVHVEESRAFREAAEGARHAPELLTVGTPDFARAVEAEAPSLDPFPSHRDDPAIWLFSGGTTGYPKAVVQPHRSYANTTELYGKGVLGMGPDDVTLSVPKLFFGYATGINLLFPFSVGATAALFPERCTADTLFEKIRAFRPTLLVNVPTMVSHLVAHPGAADQDLSCLRLATSAGEALPTDLHRRWDETFGVPLLDGLGTAEMWHVFISNRPGDVRPGTLGRVVPGFEVRVCDDDGSEVATGEAGLLRVRGGSQALGYWQQSEKTQAAFRGDWYVSGDMISMDEAGYVTYHGRADDMLKVGGKWLSPAQLEDCLLAHPAVAEVAVVGVADAEGLVKPHAFVRVAGGDGMPDPGPALEAALQRWSKERLEPYKYPRRVVFLGDFPRTHLGKVDRGALARG
jgi:benzoate-CoA ligase family protein